MLRLSYFLRCPDPEQLEIAEPVLVMDIVILKLYVDVHSFRQPESLFMRAEFDRSVFDDPVLPFEPRRLNGVYQVDFEAHNFAGLGGNPR